MYLIAIAWMYVVLMMAVAEALSSQGTVLGALLTLVLYGLLPLSIALYIMGTPLRRRARLAQNDGATEAAAGPEPEPLPLQLQASNAPDGGGMTPRDGITPK